MVFAPGFVSDAQERRDSALSLRTRGATEPDPSGPASKSVASGGLGLGSCAATSSSQATML